MSNEFVLKTEHLSIQFGGLRAVDDVNLEIRKGELYGLIGPNGAGKTTFFNLITGVYKPTSGRIFHNCREITGKTPIEINRGGIARTFQNIRLFNNLTVIENVMVGLANGIPCNVAESIFRLPRHKKSEREFYDKALALLEIFQLAEYKDYLAANLPYGKQRKLEIARAMATGPSLLLLDEPAAGMNPNETEDLRATIEIIRKQFGITILLIEHDLKFVSEICDEITVLNFGTVLAEGTAKDALSNPDVIKAYIGK